MLPTLQIIGRISGLHGFRGDLVLALDSKNYSTKLKKGNFLFIIIDEKGVPFLIEELKGNNQIISLADVNSEEIAQKFLNLSVAIEGKPAPKSSDSNSFVGYKVYSETLQEQGIIESIDNYPAGKMLVLKTEKGEEKLIPLVEEWIIKIDKKSKFLFLQLPEGI